jgi:hypothetical protein
MELQTWADFAALTDEERSAYTPEELEEIKSNISEKEAKKAEDSKKKDEELAKAKEIAENYKVRAEKAEAKAREGKEEPPKTGELSAKDALILAKADVAEEDLDEVLNYAKFRNLPVSEVLKDKTLKTILSDRAEERRTAQATNTGGSRPSTKVTGEALIEKASKGDLPEKDEDIAKLAEARMAAKIAQTSR